MGFLSSAWEGVKDIGSDVEKVAKVALSPITYPTEQLGKMLENTIRGDFSDVWDLTRSFAGDYNRELSSNLGDMGLPENNWMVQNPLESIGIAVAGTMGYTAGQEYLSTPKGAQMLETGKEWYETASKAKDIADAIGGLSGGGQQTATGRRSASYSDMIGRLNNMINQNDIDPFEEIIIPTGDRY